MNTPQTKNPQNVAPKLSFTLPKYVSFFIIVIAFVLWILFTSFNTKIRVILCSASFSLIEFSFYSTTIELPNGDLIFKPFDARCRKGHTTFAQFVANVLYLPIAFDLYYSYLGQWVIRILLFPLNIWLLEIIEGYCIMLVYGVNIAWYYWSSDSLFHGNIRLKFWKNWILLGILAEIAYKNFLLIYLP